MEKKIITISREFGAGGRSVGRIIADKLGIPLYDKALVKQIAEASGFAEKFVDEHGERSPGGSLFSYAFAPQGVPGVMNGLSTADYLWNAQCNVILGLADQGPCVIIGRNADYVLKDRPDALHVFLHGDLEFRRKVAEELLPPSTKSLDSQIAELDKRRRINYQHYTGRTWGMSQNYSMTLDTSVLGFEQAADIIIRVINNSK